MQSTVVKIIVYPLFFLACLVFFVIQGFPIGVVQGRIEREAQRKLGMKMSTGSMEIMFPNGVEAENVRLMKEGEEGKPGLAILIPRASGRISLLGLLSGSKDVSFSADLLNGKLEGDLSLNEAGSKVAAQVYGLDLGRLPIWQDLLGLNLAGKVTGKVDLTINPQNIKETKGTIRLSLEKGSLGEGKIRGLSTPAISLGKTEATLEIAKGKAEFKTFQVRSDDIEANLDGYLLLQPKLSQLSARCNLRFKPSEDFLGRNPKFADIIKLAGLNRAKDQNGFFSYSVYGRLDHPQFRPAR